MTDERLVDLYCPVCQVFRAVPPGATQCVVCRQAILLLLRPRDVPDEFRKELERERDEARYYARVLAHAILTESAPPQLVVAAAVAYPITLGEEERRAIRDEVMRRVAADLDAKTDES